MISSLSFISNPLADLQAMLHLLQHCFLIRGPLKCETLLDISPLNKQVFNVHVNEKWSHKLSK